MKKVILVLFISLFYISFAVAAIPGDCNPVPVSLWKFDGDATDSINGNTGTLSSGGYISGKVNQAVSLTGSNNVVVSDNSNLKPSSGLSIEFWYRDNLLFPHIANIVDKQGYIITVNETSIGATIGTATLTSLSPPNTDYFVVVVWDGSNANLYINNALADGPVSLSSITYSTDDLVMGDSLQGYIDELAIYNTALTPTQIADHYTKGSAGLDYCYVSSGNTSGTSRNFTLAGCDVPGWGKLAINTCFRGEPYDGEYYCNGAKELLETLNDAGACLLSIPADGRSCCPANFICEGRDVDGNPDGGEPDYCYQRLQVCSDYEDEQECNDNACYWVDGECVDPNDPSLSCGIYKTSVSCLEDIWNMGQIGAGTDICGKFTSEGMVVPRESCRCDWVSNECVFRYDILNEFYPPGGDDGFIGCNKRVETGACVDGNQNVSWTILSIIDPSPPAPTQEQLEAADCFDGSEVRSCGQPIITIPFFGFGNLIVACILISLFYFFYKEDL